MLIHLDNPDPVDRAETLSLRCPSCRQMGSFEPPTTRAITALLANTPIWLGQRMCPNPECRAHVFVMWTRKGKVVRSYPPERIDFDPSEIPARITETFEEALTCHANEAYTATAIMVRRTLEEVCAEKGATGENLKRRIRALGDKVILPPGFLSGLDNLRLMGNDAAHVDARDYDTIGKSEVEVAIDVTKELLKAVYQLESLVGRLDALKGTKGNEQAAAE